MITKTIPPPYYAVIFTSRLKLEDEEYFKTSQLLEEKARTMRGFLGFESARSEIGISISYWTDLEAITEWKNDTAHQMAKQKGILDWYEQYSVRIAKVEREY